MNPTIRDVIRRRTRQLLLIGLMGWLMFPAAAALGHKNRPVMPLFIVGGILFAVAVIGLQRVRCPKCAAPLGQFAMPIAIAWRRKINFCPYCGVSLDEPAPQKLIS